MKQIWTFKEKELVELFLKAQVFTHHFKEAEDYTEFEDLLRKEWATLKEIYFLWDIYMLINNDNFDGVEF